MRPLLSVAIPTHNRARYALHAIRSLLSIADPRLEIVVSDTSNDGELAMQVVADPTFTDVRLNYFRPEGRLDMTGNHNAALAACRGDYVCLIGDDDTVTADALEAVAWAKKAGIEVISPNVVANYVWPDFRSRFFGAGHASRLYIARRMGQCLIIDSGKALSDALEGAAQGTNGLPKIYHGFVSRVVLERMREKSGAYFHGSSPDVSGAIGLTFCCERFAVVDYPLTIPGASGGSNTGRSAMNTHKGRLSQESQTKDFESAGWSVGVPKFFSVETVWAHAALETLGRMDFTSQSRFNFARLLAICSVLHPEFDEEIRVAEVEVRQIFALDNKSFANQISRERRRFKRERLLHLFKRALRPPTAAGGRKYVGDIQTIAMAPPVLMSYMQRQGLCWSDMAKHLASAAQRLL